MKSDVIKSHIDSICAEPLTGSMVDRLASIQTTTPRPWLALRRKLRGLQISVLHAVLNVLSEALLYTNDISHAKPSELALTPDERNLIEAPFYDCIDARKLVIVLLRDDIRAVVDGFPFPKRQAALPMKPHEVKVILCRGVDCIDGKASLAERQGSTGPMAALIAGACTVFPLDIFGEVVQIKACKTR